MGVPQAVARMPTELVPSLSSEFTRSRVRSQARLGPVLTTVMSTTEEEEVRSWSEAPLSG